MKKINKKNTVILSIICIIFGIIAYGIYFHKSDAYEEFEETANTKELIPYEEEKQTTQETENEEILNDNIVVIHITGAVKNWGIIELPQNSRIADAIEKAGGLTEDADITNVNLAYILEDGMKINIPSINNIEETEYNNDTYVDIENYISTDDGDNIVTSSKSISISKLNIVNINTATQTELETLPGIGTSTALKIINYRNENGKFSSIEEIKNVSGIGDSKFNNIKKMICI
ncbi:MAG: hypothetical protein HFJ48_02310 [Clostridia bacterium]|nr:hypothetical protein [Clostridia bacterium]